MCRRKTALTASRRRGSTCWTTSIISSVRFANPVPDVTPGSSTSTRKALMRASASRDAEDPTTRVKAYAVSDSNRPAMAEKKRMASAASGVTWTGPEDGSPTADHNLRTTSSSRPEFSMNRSRGTVSPGGRSATSRAKSLSCPVRCAASSSSSLAPSSTRRCSSPCSSASSGPSLTASAWLASHVLATAGWVSPGSQRPWQWPGAFPFASEEASPCWQRPTWCTSSSTGP